MPPDEMNSELDYLPDRYPDEAEDFSAMDRGDDVGDDFEEDVSPEPEPEVEESEPEAEEPEVEESEPEAEEPEAEEPEAEEPEAEAEAEPEPKRITVPKSRLDDEIAKRRKLEEQIASLTKEQAKVETTVAQDEAFEAALTAADVMLKEANEAVLDGDLDKASKLQREAMRSVTMARKSDAPEAMDPEAMVAQLEARIELKSTLRDIYESFPMLDSSQGEVDQEFLDRAMQYEGMYADQGHSPAEAVRRAVNDAALLIRPELVAKAPAPKAKTRTEAQEKRSDLGKKVADAARQPPTMPKGDQGEPKIDLATLSDDEFDALPASTKAKLRGDF